MNALFEWLDLHPAIYPLLAGLSWVLLVARLVQLVRSNERGAVTLVGTVDWWSGVVVFLALLAWRWPYLLDPHQLNPDESQLIAGAITIGFKPAFWASFDGTTSGPLNAMVLLPTHWLGVPQDFFNARLTGMLLMWSAWAASFGLLRRWVGPVVGYVALLPVVVFLGVTTDNDILHYSSEHLSVALGCIGAWLLVVAGGRGFKGWSWWAAGFIIGLLPWAKLQSGPLAAVLSGWACAWVMLSLQASWADRLRRCAVLAVAVLLPTLIFVSLYFGGGEGVNFMASYVQNNVAYTEGRELGRAFDEFKDFSMRTMSIPAVLLVQLSGLLGGAIVAWRGGLKPGPGFSLGALATVTVIGMVLLPGKGFLHYTLFLYFPLAWWSAGALRAMGVGGKAGIGRYLGLALVVGVIFVVQLGPRMRQPLPDMFGRLAWSWKQPRSELADVIRYLKQPGDTLAVWGWAPALHVETGLPQATRESHTERQIEKREQRDPYYRPRYLAELSSDRPAFFVDAVGPQGTNYFFRGDAAHEIFPALAEYVAEAYVLVADFNRERLYLRKDRMKDVGAIAAAFERAASKWIADPWFGDRRPEFTLVTLRPQRTLDGVGQVGMMEPPAKIEWPLQGTERLMVFEFGHDPKSYAKSDQGNGTLFKVSVQQPDGEPELKWSRQLNPSKNHEDRGLQKARIEIPPVESGSLLLIETDPGPWGDGAWDWAYVVNMGFRYRPEIFLPEAREESRPGGGL